MIKHIALLLVLIPQLLFAQFDPTTVGTGSSVLLDFNTAYSGSVDEDNADDAAEDGDGVYVWQDQSGNGDDALQDTASARPTYDVDGFAGTDPCIQGASGDWMYILDKAIMRNRSAVTAAWLVDYVDNATFQAVFQNFTGDGNFNNRVHYYIDSTDQPNWGGRNPDSQANELYSNDPLTNGTEHVVIVRADYANQEISLWIDGTEVHTQALTGTSNTSDTDSDVEPLLFTSDSFGNWGLSCTAAFILWSEALSDADIGTATTGLEGNFDAPSAVVNWFFAVN